MKMRYPISRPPTLAVIYGNRDFFPDQLVTEAQADIANADSLKKASFVAPNESGKQVHIILEVTDNCTPPLTGHQRVICNIK